MKKPVKPTGEQLEAIIAKRVNKLITVRKALPSGTIHTVTEAVRVFAKENHCASV